MIKTETFYEELVSQLKENENKQALVMGDYELTYGQMIQKIDTIAYYLVKKGLKKQDKVVIWSGTHPLWLCAYYAIMRAGGVAVILNANLSIGDAKPLVEFADTSFLIYGATHDMKGSQKEISILSNAFEICEDNMVCLLETDFEAEVEKMKPSFGDEDILAILNNIEIDSKDDAYIIYTSGTTSFPKAVTSSQIALVNLGVEITDAISNGRGDKAVLAVPLFHAYGIMVSWVYLSNGGTIYMTARVKSEDVAFEVEKHDVTDIWSVAVVYQGIIDDKDLCSKVAPKVKFCTIAGSYTTPVQFMRFEAGFYNAKFINMYGMTETSAAYVMTRPEDSVEIRYNTLGRAVSGVELEIWDKDRGFLPRGEVGEIVTRGFHLKNSYYKLPSEKQAVDEEGWLHSGDLGVIDDEGNLKIAGRIKDLIIKGGENLAPGEIEAEIMNASDNIKNCRVFAFYDRIYGENVAACVVVNDKGAFDENEIKKTLKTKIGSYKTPVYFFVFDEFPLNANGKIDQNRLRNDMLTRKCKAEYEKKLAIGVTIAEASMVSSEYVYVPTAGWLEEFSKSLGFSDTKAARIRHAVEETFYICNRNTTEENAKVIVRTICTDRFLRVGFTSESLKYSFEHKPDDAVNELIVFMMVDDFHTVTDENGAFYIQLDFEYEEFFDIAEFMVHHAIIR